MNEEGLLKALADATRLRVVMLLQADELCVCDIVRVLGLPQSTVSRHIGRLREAGVVEARRTGTWMHYRLADEPLLVELRGFFYRLRQVDPYWQDRLRLQEQVVCSPSPGGSAIESEED